MLLSLYYSRPDLQEAFPECMKGNLQRLVVWASHHAKEDPDGIAIYDHVYKLMRIFYSRRDLQQAYPEANDAKDLTRLVRWAVNSGATEESILAPFADKYSAMTESEGIFHLLDNNKTLVLSFPGFSQGFGMKDHPYDFLKSIHSKGFDVLHLPDIQRAWYHFGIRGQSDNIDELVTSLREFVKGYEQIITFGTSMGGYASILFGSILNANLSIAIVPATFIDPKNRAKFNDTRHPEYRDKVCNQTLHPEFLDLKDYMSRRKAGRISFLCFYGDIDKMDELHSMRMAELDSFFVFKVTGGEHSDPEKSASALMWNAGIFDHIFDLAIEREASVKELVSFLDKQTILERILHR